MFFKLFVTHSKKDSFYHNVVLLIMPSDIFYSISCFKMSIDTFNYFWDALSWFHHSMNHEVKSWLEKHWIRCYNFEISRPEMSWNTALCCFMIRLFLNNIYLFFEGRLVFLGLFSLSLCFGPLFFFLFIFKSGKVTRLKEALSSLQEWEGAQVTLHVA